MSNSVIITGIICITVIAIFIISVASQSKK